MVGFKRALFLITVPNFLTISISADPRIDSRTIKDARLIVKSEIIRWGWIPAYLRSQPTMRRICDVKFTSLFYECKIGGTILRPTLYNKGAL